MSMDRAMESALVEKIRASPDDRARYQAYCEWLTEIGDPKAEHIRVGLGIAEEGWSSPRKSRLKKQAGELRRTHGAPWFGPLEKMGHMWCRYGFAHELHVSNLAALEHFVGYAGDFSDYPLILLRRLVIKAPRRLAAEDHERWRDALAKLAGLASMGTVENLQLAGQDVVDAASVRAALSCPGIHRLTCLSLAGLGLGADGVDAVLNAPSLPRLSRLNLSGMAHMDWDGPASWDPNIGPDGVMRLADDPRAARLLPDAVLDLSWNYIGEPHAQALVDSPHLPESVGFILGQRELSRTVRKILVGRLRG